jgi:hypothetical protein
MIDIGQARWLTVVTAALGAALVPAAAAAEGDETALTVYSSALPGAVPAELYRPLPGAAGVNARAVPGYALVRQERLLKLERGRSSVKFSDVAALIDPTTVTFVSLTDPHTRVLEQNFQFDLVSTEKLLLKYLDRPITVERQGSPDATTIEGTLLSSADGLVIRDQKGAVHALRNYSAITFPELPGGLDTRPTLVWDVLAPNGGSQRARVTYQTGGITWWADYNLIFSDGKDANSGTLDLGAWVSLVNLSGASYPEAALKLIAGDVQRLPAAGTVVTARAMALAEADAAAPGFAEKSFFEFHLYTLGRRTTLPNNSTKQIELFEQAKQIPAHKLLVYYGASARPGLAIPLTQRDLGVAANHKVDVYLEFRNDAQHGLGMPLPAGRVRVSKVDTADGALEFIGEDAIDHTPKDETVRVKLGSAFDVVGDRRQVDFSVDTRARTMEEEIEINLRNHKAQPVEVIVKESLPRWSNWTVLSKTHDFERADARTIHFKVAVPKDGQSVLRYRVRYTW